MPFAKFSPPQVRHIRESKTGLDSGFHTIDSRFQVLDSLFVELGFGILIVSRSPDSLSCISDSKAKGSGFYKQKILGIGFRIPDSGFWIPQAKIFLDSRMLYTEWNFSPWVVLSWGTVCHVSTRRLLHPVSPPASTSTFYLRAGTDFMYVNC